MAVKCQKNLLSFYYRTNTWGREYKTVDYNSIISPKYHRILFSSDPSSRHYSFSRPSSYYPGSSYPRCCLLSPPGTYYNLILIPGFRTSWSQARCVWLDELRLWLDSGSCRFFEMVSPSSRINYLDVDEIFKRIWCLQFSL